MSAKTRNRRQPRAGQQDAGGQTATGKTAKLKLDLRRPLATRPIARPYADAQMAEATAARVAAQVRLRVPVMAWRSTPGLVAYARLADSTILVHTGGGRAPFTAYVPCLLGSHHEHPVTGPAGLHAARAATDGCTTLHGDFTALAAATAASNLAQAFTGRHDAETTLSMVLPLHDKPREHPHG